jgi:hypothetical protein
MKGRVHVAMDEPPRLLNLCVRELSKSIGGIHPKPTLAGNLNLLHQRCLDVDAVAVITHSGSNTNR